MFDPSIPQYEYSMTVIISISSIHMCIYVCEEIEQFLNPWQNVKEIWNLYVVLYVTCMCDKFRQCVGQYLEVDLRVGNLIVAHKRHFQRTLLNLQYVRLAGEHGGQSFFQCDLCPRCVRQYPGRYPLFSGREDGQEGIARPATTCHRSRFRSTPACPLYDASDKCILRSVATRTLYTTYTIVLHQGAGGRRGSNNVTCRGITSSLYKILIAINDSRIDCLHIYAVLYSAAQGVYFCSKYICTIQRIIHYIACTYIHTCITYF